MTRTCAIRLSRLACAALLALALPSLASAQAQITAHKLSMSLKTVSQTFNGTDFRPDKFTAKDRDVFERCVGHRPAKDEGLYAFIYCSDEDFGGRILAIDTQPPTDLGEVGEFDVDVSHIVSTTKRGDLTTVTAPVSVPIECGANATFTVRGVMVMKFRELNGEICPYSASAKVFGTGVAAGIGSFIVNDGSKVGAGKRSSTITSVPQP